MQRSADIRMFLHHIQNVVTPGAGFQRSNPNSCGDRPCLQTRIGRAGARPSRLGDRPQFGQENLGVCPQNSGVCPQFGEGCKERGEIMVGPVVEGEVASRQYDFTVAGGEKRFGPHHNLIKWNAHRLSAKVRYDAECAFSATSILNFQISP